MQYACPAWFGIASDTDLATMDSVQARGARLACGLPATTNTYDSLLEANVPSVSEKAKCLTYKAFPLSSLRGGPRAANVARCFPPSSEIGKLHTEITAAYGSVEPLADAPTLNHRILIRPWTLQALTKEMADAVKKKVSGEAVAHRHPADYEVWTDGSYVAETSSVAGAALIFRKGRVNYQTVSVGGKGRSSFRSESLAPHAGLSRVIADRTLSRGQRLLIASDSQSLLMALRRHTARSTTSTFAECVEMLNALAGRGVKIRLQFVFGHCGVSRNELADVASNAAHGCITRYTLWHKDALSIARERIAGDASKKLEARETHRRRVVGIKPTKTKHLTGVRLLDCLASQARTNWSPYWGDLHRILNPSVPKACRFCSEPPGASSAPRPSNRPGNEDGPPMQSRALSAPWCLLRARPG
ncbi:reverse transcriptase (RNA-dependent DNA polymerase) [Perkinsela sp. CCAP 1560/4]|nr:reverse transcriptase (RNA-dependent DNA polymerase) [Perkinsela sp. CCAP 1560/4]|eukprot:KNH07226.1 reverse transcriptase (RNA-dependent DNA polymerase) [Perkinsela sp. CCAP 1560/4]